MTNPFLSIAVDVKLIVMDFDGVLTDGSIYLDSNGNHLKKFNVKDGMGIKLLQKYGFIIALITGSKDNVINYRANSLNIKLVFKGIEDKLIIINQIQQELDIKPNQTIFLGDDINDLLVLPSVKMFLSPSNAHAACLEKAHWIGRCKGGEGFIREVADLFVFALNINPNLPFASSNE
tara:strand:- start:1600 stop:2130 length:531 start_codon:yes stop_codon:yes gene_type:complete